MNNERDPLVLTGDDLQLASDLAAAGPLEITLRPETAFTLAAVIQLALRHPDMPQAPRAAAEMFLAVVTEHFRPAPFVSEILRRGNDPAYDTGGRR